MKKEKIILIFAGVIEATESQEWLNIPLGILYLGTYLHNHGYRVLLLDTRFNNNEEFLKLLQEELNDTLLVGLSVMTPLVGTALEITKFVKEKDPAIKTVWGGIHPTLFAESTIRNAYIDFVIVKEGEKGLLGLVEYLHGRRSQEDVPNLFAKENGSLVKNRIEEGVNLQDLGIPHYALLDGEKYFTRRISPGYSRRQAEVLTSRGCPYRCAFCVNPIVNKSHWRSEPLAQTLENVDYLIQKNNIEHIFFMDEDFFCKREKLKNIVGEIAKRNITWESNCRVNYVNDDYLSDDFLKLLKKSGCIKLRFGMESGNQRILDLLKKDITVAESVNAVKKVTQQGIVPAASFMMGLPTETKEELLDTLDLMLTFYKINPRVDLMGPQIFRPYPGSELFKICQEKGLAIPEKLEEWSDFFIHFNIEQYPQGLPWFPEVNLLKKVYLCLAYIRKDLKFKILKRLACAIVKFHIITKCRFIYVDYFLFRTLRKLARLILRKTSE